MMEGRENRFNSTKNGKNLRLKVIKALDSFQAQSDFLENFFCLSTTDDEERES
jgi:hypothetical protein